VKFKSFFTNIYRVSVAKTCLFFLFLSACGAPQVSDEKQIVVNNYLKILQQDSTSTGGEYECVKNSRKTDILPQNIQTWTFLGQEQKIDEQSPDSQFNLVYVKITEKDLGGFNVTNTWTVTVWRSDDLFEEQKRFYSDFNKMMSKTDTLLNNANKFLGNSESTQRRSSPVAPNRANITSQPYCVTVIERKG
jgi:hypothetical protein